jgi:hypothetical protein
MIARCVQKCVRLLSYSSPPGLQTWVVTDNGVYSKTYSELQFTSSVIMSHSLLQLLFINSCNCKYVTSSYYCSSCCFCLGIQYVNVKFIKHSSSMHLNMITIKK